MLRRAARRTATAAVTLLLVTLAVFGLIHLVPGDPLAEDQTAVVSAPLSPEARRQLRDLYRLDDPVHVRYLSWLAELARGDLGRSFRDRRPVAAKIGERLGPSLLLNTLSLTLMVALALPLGALAALRPGSRWDRLSAAGTVLLYAVPVFWAALLLQLLFAVRLDWLPIAGLRSGGFDSLGPLARLADRAAHLVLPVVCLSYAGLAYLSRFVRATLLDSEAAESWRAARARGLSPLAVVIRHGIPQAGVPMLTLAGLMIPGLVGGSVIVETIFALPGLGRLFVDAAFARDVPVVMGLTLLSGTVTLAGIILADLAYFLVDPRVRRAQSVV